MVYIGTSGYSYDWWRGVFYPEKLSKSKWFEYYENHFSTVELNVTFYRLLSLSSFEGWRKKARRGFLFSLKGSRFITHVKKLKDVKDPLEVFMKRVEVLGEHLGAILWQLPPDLKYELGRLEGFLKLLKKTPHKYHALELRNRDWARREVFELLKDYSFTVCISDHPDCHVDFFKDFPFIYIRRHGKGVLYGGSYTKKDLLRDAEFINSCHGKNIFVYFNNDQNGFAVKNALELMSILKLG